MVSDSWNLQERCFVNSLQFMVFQCEQSFCTFKPLVEMASFPRVYFRIPNYSK